MAARDVTALAAVVAVYMHRPPWACARRRSFDSCQVVVALQQISCLILTAAAAQSVQICPVDVA
jgi:hypothetical protein